MAFDPTLCCDIEVVEGVQRVTIDPDVMYPAVIAWIQESLAARQFPSELLQTDIDENDVPKLITARAEALLNNARLVPVTAWDDALLPRDHFFEHVAYIEPKYRNIALYKPAIQAEIERVWSRGDALEVALGWYLQALRCKIGGSNNKVLRDLRYKL